MGGIDLAVHNSALIRHSLLVTDWNTDAELLAAASVDAEAFGVIYDRHAHRLHGRIRRAGVPSAEARDLLAETFAQAWLHRRRFRDPGEGSLYPWLAGIARNLVRQYFRTTAVEGRARRRPQIHIDPVEPGDMTQSLDSVEQGARRGTSSRTLTSLSAGPSNYA